MLNMTLKKTLQGEILDVGSGSEGVIGRIYQAQVTAIDNRQDAAHFIALCASAGLCLSEREDAEEGFYLRFTKQEEDKELPR